MNDFEAGKIGEEFFKRYQGHLMKNLFISTYTGDLNVGGEDFNGIIVGELKESDGINSPYSYERKPHLFTDDIKAGDSDVKAIRNKTLLTRNNNGNEPSGTIEFEMWSNAWRKVNGKNTINPREVWTHGWMHGYIHPEEHTRESNVKYVRPDILKYIHYADKVCEEPYVAIVFEDYGKLVERLKTISPWRLDPWEVDFVSNKRFDHIHTPSRSYLLDNMWHVPLEAVADLATVTMINEDPYVKPGIQETRLKYLKKLAAGRHLDTKKVDREIAKVEAAHRKHLEEKAKQRAQEQE